MAKQLPSKRDIVECLSGERRALHAKEIASRLGVSPGNHSRLLELLTALSADGTLSRHSGNRFQAAADADGGKDRASWEGSLSMHPRGFGFVAAAGHEDVYVAPDGIAGAMHGDTVRVSVVGRSYRGTEGRITDVVNRRKPRVSGILRRRRKSAWLEPDDTRIRGPVVLASVPDDAQDGMAAVASITRFPGGSGENPEGELLIVLGKPGDAQTEVRKILIREQIDEEHPKDALDEAEAAAARLSRPHTGGRVDLREVPLLTIDPEDARDHDDAVYAERTETGYEVVVAIADVAEYVQEGSPLDAEAQSRGCTIYLPDRAIPMLPSGLAADLCSLLPEKERYCLAVRFTMDRRGEIVKYDVVEGLMRAAAMITYGSAARALGFTDKPPPSAAAGRFKRELKALSEVSAKLRRARMKRGSLDFDLPEAKIVLNETTGMPEDIVRRTEDPGMKRAYQMVEDLMVVANELVARWLIERQAPAIFRIHGKPDEQKLDRLSRICERLGASVDLDDLMEPGGVPRWLESISEHPRRPVLETLLLRSLKQAVYDTENIGHFGLASEAYAHFTSPIRRYPDLCVHRAVKHLCRGEKVDRSPAAIEGLRRSATESSARERASMEVEREVSDLYRAVFMLDHLGEEYEGTVTGVGGAGLYVALDHPFVDVLVRFESLGQDHYELTDDELGVVGTRSGDSVALGDRILVHIEDASIIRRQVLGRRVTAAAAPQKDDSRPGRGRGRKAQARQAEAGRSGARAGGAPPPAKKSRAEGSARGSRGAASRAKASPSRKAPSAAPKATAGRRRKKK
jgi:ribonuclease R